MSTFLIGLGLIAAGFVAVHMFPTNTVGIPLLIAGSLVIMLRVFGAVAADLPVPPKGVTSAQMRAAIADQERRKRASKKEFEDMLSSPIGKGRME